MPRARPFNLAEDNVLLAGREKGETWASIARHLNRHPSSIQARHRQLKEPIQSMFRRTSQSLSTRAKRKCLGPLCGGKLFESEHSGHRICPRCAKSDPFQSSALG